MSMGSTSTKLSFRCSRGLFFQLGILTLALAMLTACGGPSLDPGATPEDTAKAFIAAWEAKDAAHLDQLIEPGARQALGTLHSMGQWLDQQANAYGSPVQGQGRVLHVNPNGNQADADIAVVYDCKSSNCTAPVGQPDWVPKGNAVAAEHLSLKRQFDGKWLVVSFSQSSYLSDQAAATQQAIAAPTYTAQAAYQQALVLAQQTNIALTQLAIPTAIPVPTDSPVPTQTPTPVAVYLTAKKAYEQTGVADALHSWSADAVLFRVFDQIGSISQYFQYDAGSYHTGCCDSEPYTKGDGTSRQWLFYGASPSKQELKVIRVLDGKIDRQDVSAAYYRDLFRSVVTPAPSGTGTLPFTPTALDPKISIDSDEATKIALQNGYQADDLTRSSVQLSVEDPKDSEYKAGVLNWALFGRDGKVIELDAKTGAIIHNDF